MKKSDIYIGQRFGKWTVVGLPESRRIKNGSCRSYVAVVCDCGTPGSVSISGLSSGQSTSCSCSRIKHKVKAGDMFGRLSIIRELDREIGSKGEKKRVVECVCACGIIKTYKLQYLLTGHTKSCGCYHRDTVRIARAKKKGARTKNLLL